MRRLALLAAAAVLGSGCIVHGNCDSNTITVQWSGFVAGDGTVLSCGTGAVANVDIFMNGQPVAEWPCTDYGATIGQVAPGTYTLTVEGIESSGRIAFRDEFQASAGSCSANVYTARMAEGWVDVAYAFQGGGSCAGNPSYLWFAISDDVAGAVTAQVDQTLSPTQYVCGVYATPGQPVPPDALFLPFPAGPYHLNWIEEILPTSSGFTLAAANCTPTPFTVQGGVTNTVPVTLTDAPPATACH